jgi:heme oxygenase
VVTAACAPVTMLDRLERDTREHHAAAAADLFRVVASASPAAFARFLAATYHFEYAVEARLVRVDGLPLGFLASRLRSGRLGDDLLALGDDRDVVDVLARPLAIPELESPLDAVGWLYVVERDTLDHAALYQALAPRVGAVLRFASRYLTARAVDARARWDELGAMIDHFAANEDRAARVVAAARDAFAARHRWFAEVDAPRSVEVALGRS